MQNNNFIKNSTDLLNQKISLINQELIKMYADEEDLQDEAFRKSLEKRIAKKEQELKNLKKELKLVKTSFGKTLAGREED